MFEKLSFHLNNFFNSYTFAIVTSFTEALYVKYKDCILEIKNYLVMSVLYQMTKMILQAGLKMFIRHRETKIQK